MSIVEFLSPREVEAPGANAVDLLAARHTQQRAAQRLAAGQNALHLLQYALDPQHELVAFDRAWVAEPGDDAFSASWKAIMRRLCGQGRLSAARCGLSAEYRATERERQEAEARTSARQLGLQQRRRRARA